MKRVGRARREARERACLDLGIGPCVRPVSDLLQTPEDHLIFANSCPEPLAPVLRCWRKKARKIRTQISSNGVLGMGPVFKRIPERPNGCGRCNWQRTTSKLTRTTWASRLKAWALEVGEACWSVVASGRLRRGFAETQLRVNCNARAHVSLLHWLWLSFARFYFRKRRRAGPEAGFQSLTQNTYLNRVFKLVGRAGGNAGGGSVKPLWTY